MLDNIYLGGLQDMASGFNITAQNVPTGKANMLLAKPITFISFIITIAGTLFAYIIPCQFILKGLIACTPIGNLFKGGGNSMGGFGGGFGGGNSTGIKAFLHDNAGEFLIACLFALNAATGLWASEMGLLSTGLAAGIQKIINANWSTADSPASIKQFKDDVKVYDDSQCAELYESYLKTEENEKQQLTRYVESNHPDASDMNYTKQKAAYTATVCRLQILSEKLTKDNYAKNLGVSDANYFKRHLQTNSATSNTEAPFNPNFIVSSMASSFGTQIPSANSN